MKRLLLFLFLASTITSHAQNYIGNYLTAKRGLRVGDWTISGFQRDTNFVNDYYLPTSLAVKKFIEARLAGIAITGGATDTLPLHDQIVELRAGKPDSITISNDTLYEWRAGVKTPRSKLQTSDAVISDWRKNNYQLTTALNLSYANENKQTVTLYQNPPLYNNDESFIHALLYAKGKIWATTNGDNAKFLRFNNPDDLTDYDTIRYDISTYGSILDMVYIPVKDKFYALFNNTSSLILSQINPTSLAHSDIINVSLPGTDSPRPESLAFDSNYLYIVINRQSGTTYSTLVKYSLSDFSFVDSVQLIGLKGAHAIRYDGTNLYVTGQSSPGWIAKVNPSTLTYTSATFTTGDNVATDDLAFAGDYAWVGIEASNGYMLKVKKSDLSITRFNTGIAGSKSYGTFFDGKYIWSTIPNTTPARLLRINPETEEVFQLLLDSAELSPSEICSDGQRLFIGTYEDPAMMIRITAPSLNFVKSQVDVNVVHLNGDETITGNKSFENTVVASAGVNTTNVTATHVETLEVTTNNTASAAAPSAGHGIWYSKTDNLPYFKNSAGVEMPLYNDVSGYITSESDPTVDAAIKAMPVTTDATTYKFYYWNNGSIGRRQIDYSDLSGNTDTTKIPNFSDKVRSLFSATDPVSYSNGRYIIRQSFIDSMRNTTYAVGIGGSGGRGTITVTKWNGAVTAGTFVTGGWIDTPVPGQILVFDAGHNDWVNQTPAYEATANKATDFSTVNNTKYPSVQAVVDYLTANYAPIGDSSNIYIGANGLYKDGDTVKIHLVSASDTGTVTPAMKASWDAKATASDISTAITNERTASATYTNKTLTEPIIQYLKRASGNKVFVPDITSAMSTSVSSSIASNATPSPTGDAWENRFYLTALATNVTFGAPSGSPGDGNTLLIRIKDDGTSRTIAWNAIYRASTDFALPTATTISKTMYVQFIYNAADSKWDAIGLTQGF